MNKESFVVLYESIFGDSGIGLITLDAFTPRDAVNQAYQLSYVTRVLGVADAKHLRYGAGVNAVNRTVHTVTDIEIGHRVNVNQLSEAA